MTFHSNTIYLESYIESTASLPPELQRILATIKSLDEACIEVQEEIQKSLEEVLAGKPAHDQAAVSQLQSKLDADHQRLLQMMDERLQLAYQAYDLLDMHIVDLDQVLEEFDAELQANQALNPSVSSDLYASYDHQPKKGKFDMGWEGMLDGPQVSLKHAAQKGKRPRDVDEGTATSHKKNYGSGGLNAQVESDFVDEEVEGFLNPPLPGLANASKDLQRPGRMLMVPDIHPNLRGRQAELYWPDDELWYVIEIHSVDVANRTAKIMYRTGETEVLNLDEIIREGHMSLID